MDLEIFILGEVKSETEKQVAYDHLCVESKI